MDSDKDLDISDFNPMSNSYYFDYFPTLNIANLSDFHSRSCIHQSYGDGSGRDDGEGLYLRHALIFPNRCSVFFDFYPKKKIIHNIHISDKDGEAVYREYYHYEMLDKIKEEFHLGERVFNWDYDFSQYLFVW